MRVAFAAGVLCIPAVCQIFQTTTHMILHDFTVHDKQQYNLSNTFKLSHSFRPSRIRICPFGGNFSTPQTQYVVWYSIKVPPAFDRVRLEHPVDLLQILVREYHISSCKVLEISFRISANSQTFLSIMPKKIIIQERTMSRGEAQRVAHARRPTQCSAAQGSALCVWRSRSVRQRSQSCA